MSPGPSSAARRLDRARRHARLDTLAVAVLGVLTILMWVVAVPAVRDALAAAGAEPVSAQVVQCPQDRILAPPCQVTFELQGATVTGTLRQGMVFGVEPGERIDIYPVDDGTVRLAGRRAFADPALLVLLSLATTSYTLRRWTRLGPTTRRTDRTPGPGRRELRRPLRGLSGSRRTRVHPAA